jgi:hypothetical protein
MSPPDGVVIVHYPADGSERYGIGPFPPIDGLVDMMLADAACGCRLAALWVRFPKGIVMAVSVPDDMKERVSAMAAALLHEDDSDLLH